MNLYQTVFIVVLSCFSSKTVGQWQTFSNNNPEYFSEPNNNFQSNINSAPYPVRFNQECNSYYQGVPSSFNTGEFSLGNVEENNRLPPYAAVNLFTPNTIDQPAETQGQINEYNKDLEERARELERERNGMMTSNEAMMSNADINPAGNTDSSEQYVNFNHRDFSYAYSV